MHGRTDGLDSGAAHVQRRVDRFAQTHQRRNDEVQVVVQVEAKRLERVQHLNHKKRI